jgi:hypothetical protein
VLPLLLLGLVLQVLSAYVSQQEQLQSTLQCQLTWVDQLAAASRREAKAAAAAAANSDHRTDSRQQQQQQGVCTRAGVSPAAGAPVPSPLSLPQPRHTVPGGLGYIQSLLASATLQDVQQAIQITPQGFQEFLVHTFRAMTSLLELSKRSWPVIDGRDCCHDSAGCGSGVAKRRSQYTAEDEQQQQQALTGSSSSGGESKGRTTSSGGCTPSIGSGCDTDSGGGTAAAATAAAAAATVDDTGIADDGSSGVDALRAAAASARQQLELQVDHYLRFAFLVLIHNTLTIYSVGATNLVTSETAVAPPQHWLQVIG